MIVAVIPLAEQFIIASTLLGPDMGFYVSKFCLIADGENSVSIAQLNGQYAFLFAAIAIVFTLAISLDYYQRRHSKLVVICAAFLTLTHPAWTVNATGPDLGYVQRNLAFIFTAIVVLLFLLRSCVFWSKKSHSFQSAFFGAIGAAIGFLAFGLFVYSTAVLSDPMNVELILIKRFGSNAFIYFVLFSFPFSVFLGCLLGLWYARVIAVKLRAPGKLEFPHPLD